MHSLWSSIPPRPHRDASGKHAIRNSWMVAPSQKPGFLEKPGFFSDKSS